MENRIITIENRVVSMPVAVEVWMTQHEISGLLECFVSKVNANVRALLKTGVLDEASVCRTYHYRNGNFVEQYNLEMITALSFRIKSRNAKLFRSFIMEKAVANTNGKPILMIGGWNKNCNIFPN